MIPRDIFLLHYVPLVGERLTARTSQVVMESFRYTGRVFVEMLEKMRRTKGVITGPKVSWGGVTSHQVGVGGGHSWSPS